MKHQNRAGFTILHFLAIESSFPGILFLQNNFQRLHFDALSQRLTTEKWSFIDAALYYKRNRLFGSLLDGIYKRNSVVRELYKKADYSLASLKIDPKWKGDYDETQKVIQRYQQLKE